MSEAETTTPQSDAAPTEAQSPGAPPPQGGDKGILTGGQGDGKPEGEDAGQGAEGAPETYEDFTMPEGIEIDKEMLDGFTPIAKELGLSQQNAQKLVSLYGDRIAAIAQRAQTEQAEAMAAERAAWVEQLKADPDIGGAKFNQSVGLAIKALDRFAGNEFRQLLDETGLSSHPAMVRAFYKIGKAMAEDEIQSGQGKAPVPQSAAHLIYPDYD